MQLVRTALGNDVDLHAHVAAVLRRISAGLHLKFLNGVNGRPKGGCRDQVIHDADAIHGNVVLYFARACPDIPFAAPRVTARRLAAGQHGRNGKR